VQKGYFADWNNIRHHGGKLWVAPSTVIRADVRATSRSED